MRTEQSEKIAVLGLGYVGLTLAMGLADVGFRVCGVDINPEVVDSLRRGSPHIFEPGLQEILRRSLRNERFSVHREPGDIVDADVWVIAVGTPLGGDGRVRLDMIEASARDVARHLKPGDLVIMRSTVKIGATRSTVIPILESAGVPFEIAFCPERTVEGDALNELRSLPQIIGADDFGTAMRASHLFMRITPTVVRVDRLETAELIKLVDNSSRDVMFGLANEIARVCDALGISAAEVINSGKLGYPRTNLPMPGPVGGPCLAKDSAILAQSLERFRVKPEIIRSARQVNERQPVEAVSALARVARSLDSFPAKPIVALLGIAFKGRPVTDDIRQTMALPILQALRQEWPDAEYRTFDPVVPLGKLTEFGGTPYAEMGAALEKAHLAVVLNNHPAFGSESLVELAGAMARPSLVYDFWNHFSQRDIEFPVGVSYMALGSHALYRVRG